MSDDLKTDIKGQFCSALRQGDFFFLSDADKIRDSEGGERVVVFF